MVTINDFIFPQTFLETMGMCYIKLLSGNEIVSVIAVMLVNYLKPEFQAYVRWGMILLPAFLELLFDCMG